jgi:hypothetical protein
MKTYQTLLSLSKEERETELKTSTARAIAMTAESAELQKDVAKMLVAMTKSGEITDGDLAKTGKAITGEDIRRTFQNVYPLVKVFTAIVEERIAMTEAQFDKGESSKLALLGPLCEPDADEEAKAKLADCVAALTGEKPPTAKELREKIGGEKKEPKAVKEQRERAEKAESEAADTKKMLESVFENGTIVPVGFMATDITRDEALATSRQFKDRIKADIMKALDNGDADTLEIIKEVFGKVFLVACSGLGEDPLDFIAETGAANATPAKGEVIETPALAAA